MGNALGPINYKLLRIIWETVGIHTEPLENLWGLLVGNPFVGKGTSANRTHPHACDIPYKKTLPVLCTHRFPGTLFSFFSGCFFRVVSGRILGGFWIHFGIHLTCFFSHFFHLKTKRVF